MITYNYNNNNIIKITKRNPILHTANAKYT